jgi:hypothetical protein
VWSIFVRNEGPRHAAEWLTRLAAGEITGEFPEQMAYLEWQPAFRFV